MSAVLGTPRLPTRCPTCKGAVVQRMAGRTHGSYVWFYCYFCEYTWKYRPEEPRSSDGELTGDVFVAAGKRRHPLGSVVVHAIPADALKKHLERKAAQREFEVGKLQREMDALAATLEKARAEEDRLWQIQKEDENDLRKASAWSVAYNNTRKITKHVEDLQKRRRHLTSVDHFFSDLPAASATATTSADGTFTLAIPRDGRYGIVARASREVGGEKQTYFWFVWVTVDGAMGKRLALNDDNVIGAGSRDSALQ